MTPISKFDDLLKRSNTFATITALGGVNLMVKDLQKALDDYTCKVDTDRFLCELRSELWSQIEQRLQITTFDQKIQQVEKIISTHYEEHLKEASKSKLFKKDITLAVERQSVSISENQKEIQTKLDKKEGKEIWENFNKFAVYDDLRDLYQRTIPAISLFEDKIKQMRDELA